MADTEETRTQTPEGASFSPATDVGGGTTPSLDLDLARLLNPISPDRPTGVLLRYEGTYDKIAEARREENADLPQGVWERDLKKANWEQVKTLCLEALATKSKDIQIAVWLMEALIQLHGLDGVRKGLNLLLGLMEKFWDGIFPEIDADDTEARMAPLIWLNEKLSMRLKFIPMTIPQSTDANLYCLADWESANRLEKLAVKDPEARVRAEDEGHPTRAKFLSSVMFSPRALYSRQAADIAAALSFLEDLNALCDKQCGQTAPSLNLFRETLEQIQALVDKFLKEKPAEAPDTLLPEETGKAPDVTGHEETGELGVLSIASRAEAYTLLSAAADYLLIHEPHSPTPHLVKRAVRWGHMSLTELLRELVNDDGSLKQIISLLGMRSGSEQKP